MLIDSNFRPAVRKAVAIAGFAGIAAALFVLPTHGQRQPAARARWATIHWQQVPLADALAGLAVQFGGTIFLDRRIDPTKRISLELQNAGAVEAIAKAAAAAGAGGVRVGTMTYVCPLSTADELRTLAALRQEEIARLPAERRETLTRRRMLKWPRLTEPRQLITAAVAERDWKVSSAELIPHDLWPSGSLPALAFGDQLTVLLAGFDLTFRLGGDAQSLEIVPISRPVTLSRRYKLRYAEVEVPQLRQQFPNLNLRVDGEWAAADARLEDHERLAAWLEVPLARASDAGRPAGAGRGAGLTGTKQVFTLRVQDEPVRAVLDALTKRLNWPLELDEEAIRAAGLSLDRRVSFQVENADQDQLLDALLRPAGLAIRRDGARLRVVPGG